MNNQIPLLPALLDRLIATLLAFFGVPARLVRALSAPPAMKARFAEALRFCRENGHALRYAGESDATVEKRVRYIEWLAADPWEARRVIVRGLRTWEAHRFASFMVVKGLPPCIARDVRADACVFEACVIDTS